MTAEVIANAQHQATKAVQAEAAKVGATAQSVADTAVTQINGVAQHATTVYNAVNNERIGLKAEIAAFPTKAMAFVKSHAWAFVGGAVVTCIIAGALVAIKLS